MRNVYHGCKLVSMGNSPFLKAGRGCSKSIIYWPGLWVVTGTHFQLSGCEWPQICRVRWQSDPGALVAATTEITLSYSHSRWSLFKQKEGLFSLSFQLPDWVWTFTGCVFSKCWVPWTQSFNPNPSSVFSQSSIKPQNPLVTQQRNNPNLWFVNQQLKPSLPLALKRSK